METRLRVASVNILIDRSRWVERRPLLAAQLDRLRLDLIALQEVSEPIGSSSAHWLARELGGYSVHVSPKTGPRGHREGIAVLSRWPVEKHEPIDLGSQRRTAQLVHARAGERPLVFANGHFFWPVGAHQAQVRQVKRVVDSIRKLGPGTAVVVCGDFNATPDSAAVCLMRQTLKSAHASVHGGEPEFTFPSGLISGGRARRAMSRSVIRLLSHVPGAPWRWTLDYIFVSQWVRVLEAGVFLDQPSLDDPSLYPSDHLGVYAVLEIPSAGA